MFAVSLASYALSVPYHQDQNPRRRNNRQPAQQTEKKDTMAIKAQPIIEDDDSIPDSLLNARWKIQRTLPITVEDLDQNAADLKRPDNLKQEVEYND